jgi:hypothetical protein
MEPPAQRVAADTDLQPAPCMFKTRQALFFPVLKLEYPFSCKRFICGMPIRFAHRTPPIHPMKLPNPFHVRGMIGLPVDIFAKAVRRVGWLRDEYMLQCVPGCLKLVSSSDCIAAFISFPGVYEKLYRSAIAKVLQQVARCQCIVLLFNGFGDILEPRTGKVYFGENSVHTDDTLATITFLIQVSSNCIYLLIAFSSILYASAGRLAFSICFLRENSKRARLRLRFSTRL